MSLYNSDFHVYSFKTQDKTKHNRQCHASPPHPARWRMLLCACLSGRHVWNNFYHTSHQMFSHFSDGHFYQEWKLPHVAWKLRSLKRAAARGFAVPLRPWSSLKAFSGLSIQLPGKSIQTSQPWSTVFKFQLKLCALGIIVFPTVAASPLKSVDCQMQFGWL